MSADPFQELVDTLKRILTRSASPPLPASISTPVTSAINSSSPVMFASPMARPAPYSGEPEECNGFLLQCSLTIDLHPQMFLTDQVKIAFVITSLTGPALRWAETVLSQAGPATHSYGQFLAHFREVFSSSPGGLVSWRTVIQTATGLNDHPPIYPEFPHPSGCEWLE